MLFLWAVNGKHGKAVEIGFATVLGETIHRCAMKDRWVKLMLWNACGHFLLEFIGVLCMS